MAQGLISLSITNELFNQITPTAHAGSAPEGPFVLIILHHLKLWERHITMGAHHDRGETREVFNFAPGNIKPVIPPVASLIASTGN
jgi:hypothetical protein